MCMDREQKRLADEKMARAYWDLESPIGYLHGAALVFETVFEDVLHSPEKRADHYVFTLTEDQITALRFASMQYRDRVREVREAYYEAFGERI